MCDYKFKDGTQCKEKPLPGFKYFILHTPFPEDSNSEEFKRIAKLKEEKVKEKIKNGDFNFEEAMLLNVDFSEMTIKGGANFTNTTVILGDLKFVRATIIRDARFDGATIKGNVQFSTLDVQGELSFKGTIFREPQVGEKNLSGGKVPLRKARR